MDGSQQGVCVGGSSMATCTGSMLVMPADDSGWVMGSAVEKGADIGTGASPGAGPGGTGTGAGTGAGSWCGSAIVGGTIVGAIVGGTIVGGTIVGAIVGGAVVSEPNGCRHAGRPLRGWSGAAVVAPVVGCA